MNGFSVLANKYLESFTIYNTFDYKHSTYAGEERTDALRKRLSDSSVLVAIITDSYLRSPICLSELSSFWYANKCVVPLVFNGDTGVLFLRELFGKDIIHVDAKNVLLNPGNTFCTALSNNGFYITKIAEAEDDFNEFFKSCSQAVCERKYIGMLEEHYNILDYCNKYGVKRFQNTSLKTDEISEKLSGMDEIILLSTTGATLINNLSAQFLPSVLKSGTDFTVLLPNKGSQYIVDVAEIEMPWSTSVNVERLNNEFDNVVINLFSVVNKCWHSSETGLKGRVYIGNAYTFLRQTVIAGRKNNFIWGWTSLTIPPKKTSDGTPSFEFSGEMREKSIASMIWEHLSSIKRIASIRNKLFEICPDSDIKDFSFGLEPSSAKNKWQNMYDKAKLITEEHRRLYEKVLIEVAAQHPLNTDGTPSSEFATRLNYSVELYNKLKQDNIAVKIFVPGSVHKYKDRVDKTSLSQSGFSYLVQSEVSSEDILGEAEIKKYKGDKGVYNSADECFVASEIFKDGDYGKLLCVCSPNQLVRKQLFYIAFGVTPFIYSVPCDEMAHDPVYELFEAIPDVIYNDHTWQDNNSPNGNRTRNERKPV